MGTKGNIGSPQGISAEILAGWVGSPVDGDLVLEKGWMGDENGIARLIFDSEKKALFCTLRSPSTSSVNVSTEGFITSEDGLNWTETLNSAVQLYNSYYVVECNGKLFTINRYGNVYYSTDGTTWTQVSKPLSAASKLYSYNNTLILRADNKNIYYSKDDGVTWTKLNIQGALASSSFFDVLYGKLNGETEEKFYIVCENPSSSGSSDCHTIHVYSKDFNYEKTISTLLFGNEVLLKGAAIAGGYLTVFGFQMSTYSTYMRRYVDGNWNQDILAYSFDEMYNVSCIDDIALFFFKETVGGTEVYYSLFTVDGDSYTVKRYPMGASYSQYGIKGRMAVHEGRMIGVVGIDGTSLNTIAYSDDAGQTWTRVTVTAVKAGSDLALLLS